MPIPRLLMTLVGLLALAMGLLWMAQGSGLFPYPAASFMINQSIWIVWGGLLAIAGLAITIAARRFRR